jgi:SAM-dependent methyltransferase
MEKRRFYDSFHKDSSSTDRVIGRSNFTYRLIIHTLDEYLDGKNKQNILDFGCGVGTLDFYLATKGHMVTGFDISKKAIDVARVSAEKLNLEKRTSFHDLEKGIEMPGKKYDWVILTEVIEHVEEDAKLVKSLAGRLKKGGHILLTTPSRNAPLYRWGFADEFDKRVGHLRRYTKKSLENVLTGAGFEVLEIKDTEGIIRNSLFVIPILGYLVRFIKGPIADIVTFMDKLIIPFFGESNLFIIGKKK